MRLIDYPGYIEGGRIRLAGTDLMELSEDRMQRVCTASASA